MELLSEILDAGAGGRVRIIASKQAPVFISLFPLPPHRRGFFSHPVSPAKHPFAINLKNISICLEVSFSPSS